MKLKIRLFALAVAVALAVPGLADEGMYIASESAMYRLQKRVGLGAHRRPVLRTHVARRHNEHAARFDAAGA